MHPALQAFLRQFIGVVAAALAVVALVTFISVPMNLGTSSGNAYSAEAPSERHLT